jgi:hypothetical protein
MRQPDVIVDMRVLSQISILGENPKIWYQQFNGLRTPKLPQKATLRQNHFLTTQISVVPITRNQFWLRISSGHECHSGTEREILISLARFYPSTNSDKLSDPLSFTCHAIAELSPAYWSPASDLTGTFQGQLFHPQSASSECYALTAHRLPDRGYGSFPPFHHCASWRTRLHSPYDLSARHGILAACLAPHRAFQGHAAHTVERPTTLSPRSLSAPW